MLKKVLILVLAGLLAVVLAAGTAWAEPGKDNGLAGAPGKSGTKVEKKVDKVKAWAQNKDGEVKPGNGPKSDKIKVYREKYKNMIKGESVVGGIKFKDLKNNHWAKDSIQRMSALGLFSGYSDGTFKPNNNISQAELVALVMRLVEVTGVDEDDVDEETEEELVEEETTDEDVNEEENTEEEATDEDVNEEENTEEEATDEDVNEEENIEEEADDEEELEEVPTWVREQVKNAVQMRIINLNRFHSHVQASRAQTAVVIAKAIGLEPVDTEEMPFVDGILISKEDVGYIMALYQEGLIKGMPGGKFNPNSAITRAEMAALIERILAAEEENGDEEQTGEETMEADENDTENTEDGEDEEQVVENDGETGDESDESGENTEEDGEQ